MPDIDQHMLLYSAMMFLRISIILFFLPFFSESVISPVIRILCAFSIFLFVRLQLGFTEPAIVAEWSLARIVTLILKEIFLGALIGFCSKMIFAGITMASSLVGYQMGFGTANLMVPYADSETDAFTAFHRLIALLIFLGLNFHALFLNAIIESFRSIPVETSFEFPNILSHLVAQSADIFRIGLQLATPVLVTLMFTMSALGLAARTVPQLQGFTLRFPLSFIVGLATYLAMIPFFPAWFHDVFTKQGADLIAMIKGLAA